ncbi:hypothetical protein RFI_32152 [Reticulomyxa filosa]|uniref:Uncharacterized protein n=1 Tax=Reticulomyxa filosa TaxID=46433 RepID=X6LVR5_RETFI|nr:hypothetical protein RFI_32152 [Reticulomyxa filosa]|eukprot:ETO05242.1 hypothetical protein RFI_32152 [Reticulomyxa filosa]
MFAAPAMYAFQYKYGERRAKGGLPLRGLLYLAVGIFPYFTLVTALAGGMWTITAIFDILAWSKKEEYEPEAKKEPSEGWKVKLEKYTTCSYYVNWLKDWWEELRKQSKVRKYAFLGAYLLFNLIYVSERCAYYQTVVSTGNAAGSDYSSKLHSKDTKVSNSLTAMQKTLAQLYDKNGGRLYGSWFPVAKMFGNLCDINCAFIVLPVCR